MFSYRLWPPHGAGDIVPLEGADEDLGTVELAVVEDPPLEWPRTKSIGIRIVVLTREWMLPKAKGLIHLTFISRVIKVTF